MGSRARTGKPVLAPPLTQSLQLSLCESPGSATRYQVAHVGRSSLPPAFLRVGLARRAGSRHIGILIELD